MDKKLQKLLSILLMVALACCFNACSDDDGDGDDEPGGDLKSELQGSWGFDHATVKVMGQTVSFGKNNLDELADYIGADGFWDETLNFSGNKCNGIEYEIKGNKFRFKGSEYAEMDLEATIEIKSGILHFCYDMSDVVGMDCTEDLYYKRK
ncbi:MAG: hypothetical protein ACI30K_02610 [Muribaculaceae bacterium]